MHPPAPTTFESTATAPQEKPSWLQQLEQQERERRTRHTVTEVTSAPIAPAPTKTITSTAPALSTEPPIDEAMQRYMRIVAEQRAKATVAKVHTEQTTTSNVEPQIVEMAK